MAWNPFRSGSRRFSISIDTAVNERISAELKQVVADQRPSEAPLGFLIFDRAIQKMLDDGRYFLFRRASPQECQDAEVGFVITETESGNILGYHFYEVRGYRFVLLLNISLQQGSLIHFERIPSGRGKAVELLRGAASIVRSSAHAV